MSWIRLSAVVFLGCVLAAASAEPPVDKIVADKSADPLGDVFERLKALNGEWQDASPTPKGPKGEVMVRYRPTAGGTALSETLFPGTDLEMLSVYHREGEQLVMTHYCCMGNQPHMRAKLGKNNDEVVFEFVGGTNLDPAKDGHIHGGFIRFIDADHVHSEWDFYSKGKLKDKHVLDLVRKK
jgi:hypothetical protein